MTKTLSKGEEKYLRLKTLSSSLRLAKLRAGSISDDKETRLVPSAHWGGPADKEGGKGGDSSFRICLIVFVFVLGWVYLCNWLSPFKTPQLRNQRYVYLYTIQTIVKAVKKVAQLIREGAGKRMSILYFVLYLSKRWSSWQVRGQGRRYPGDDWVGAGLR